MPDLTPALRQLAEVTTGRVTYSVGPGYHDFDITDPETGYTWTARLYADTGTETEGAT